RQDERGCPGAIQIDPVTPEQGKAELVINDDRNHHREHECRLRPRAIRFDSDKPTARRPQPVAKGQGCPRRQGTWAAISSRRHTVSNRSREQDLDAAALVFHRSIMPNPLLSDRNVDFLLYELLDVESLCSLPAFAEHSRETFDLYLMSMR